MRSKALGVGFHSYGLLEGLLASWRARMADRLIPQALRNGRILDIGCGRVPVFLLETSFREKHGLDVAFAGCRQTAGLLLQAIDLQREAPLPFHDGHFNVVTMLAVWEHIRPSHLPLLLREIRRILAPHGRLIITTPCPWSDPLLRIMALIGLVSRAGMAEHQGAYSHAAIARYLDRAGFERRGIRAGYFEWFLNSWVYVDNYECQEHT